MHAEDLVGERFGNWEVKKRAANRQTRAVWLCECICGTLSEVYGGNLRRGLSKGCGCNWAEVHPEKFKHGRAETKEWHAWSHLRQRCDNPNLRNYSEYGGRGITYDPAWVDFANFFADMGEAPSPEHSIDRIDNDGNYCKSNCKWSTASEQALNRRVCLKTGGKNLHQLAAELGITVKAYKFKRDHGRLPVKTE
jgi:hypothetical protein